MKALSALEPPCGPIAGLSRAGKMDPEMYEVARQSMGLRYANELKRQLERGEIDYSVPDHRQADGGSSNNGQAAATHPDMPPMSDMVPVSAASPSSSSSSSATTASAASSTPDEDPDFFISPRAAADKNLRLLRRYRGALRCLDCGDLLASARLAPLLRGDPALFFFVSLFFKDPYIFPAREFWGQDPLKNRLF
jgi:hypothetical protein